MFEYNDYNKKYAKDKIDFELNLKDKRIFLLTDGEVDLPEKVVSLI